MLTREVQAQLRRSQGKQKDSHAGSFRGTADIAESKGRPRRPAVRAIEVFPQSLKIERTITQPNVALAKDRPAVAEHAIVGHAFAEQPGHLTQAHGITTVGVGRTVQAIML